MFITILQVLSILIFVSAIIIVCAAIGFRALKARGSYDGQIVITTREDGSKLFSLQLEEELEMVEKRELVTFKIIRHKESIDDPV